MGITNFSAFLTICDHLASNCKKHGRLPHAVRELCLWIERTVKEASVTLQENLYPGKHIEGRHDKHHLVYSLDRKFKPLSSLYLTTGISKNSLSCT